MDEKHRKAWRWHAGRSLEHRRESWYANEPNLLPGKHYKQQTGVFSAPLLLYARRMGLKGRRRCSSLAQ